MFHMEVHLDYNAATQIKKLDAVDHRELSEAFPGLDLPDYPIDAAWNLPWDKREFVVDRATAEALLKHKVEFTIRRFKGQARQSDPSSVTNISITLPNLGLFMVDEIELRQDCCTEELKDMLKEGWRIVAVCPPLDARRPDYIMGRSSYLRQRGD